MCDGSGQRRLDVRPAPSRGATLLCVSACTCVPVLVCTCARVSVRVSVIHLHIHTHTYMPTCIHTHIGTRTHTCRHSVVVELLDGAGEAFGPISYSHHYSVAHPLPPHGYAHGRFSLPEHASLPLYVLIQKCLCVSLSTPSYNVCVCMCPHIACLCVCQCLYARIQGIQCVCVCGCVSTASYSAYVCLSL